MKANEITKSERAPSNPWGFKTYKFLIDFLQHVYSAQGRTGMLQIEFDHWNEVFREQEEHIISEPSFIRWNKDQG